MAVQGRTDFQNFALLLSGSTLARDAETILQDAARATVLATNTLMARVLVAVPTTGTADAGNTAGTGTMTALALIAGTLPRVGTYTVECIAKVAGAGTFKVVDPGGNIVGTVTGGVTAYLPQIGVTFIVNVTATDYEVGDKFTYAVTAGTKWTPFDPDAVNGAQFPKGIFVGDAIAAATLVAGDVVGQPILVAGVGATFDDSLLVIENGATLATVLPGGSTLREALYGLGFFAESTVDITKLEN